MVSNISDDEVRNIICHLSEADSKLNLIHVSPVKQRNHMYSCLYEHYDFVA